MSFANELADEARRFLRRRFRGPLEIEIKADGSPVTDADRELETRLRRRIRAAFPGHGILGEEGGPENPEAEFVWVLDPIDGTKAFASGDPLFGTLIGLALEGRPLLGVIEAAATRERWVGMRGLDTTCDGKPARVRALRPVDSAVVCLGSPWRFPEDCRAGLFRLNAGVGWSLVQLDCYAYGMLARGDVDAVIENGLGPHDVCALVPVVEGAGGSIQRWDGGSVGLDAAESLIACSDRRLAGELLGRLRESPAGVGGRVCVRADVPAGPLPEFPAGSR